MGYVGNAPAEKYTTIDKQTLTGNSTVGPYTLTHSVGNEQEIEVFVNNVRQEPSVSYTVSSNQLTMSASVASADDFYVIFQGKAKMTATHPPTFDLTAANGTFTGTVTTGGLTVGSDTAKTKFYSNSTYNGIYNGSALTNNESIYMGSGTLFFYSGGGERMRIDASGNVGIGRSSLNIPLEVKGRSADGRFLRGVDNGGTDFVDIGHSGSLGFIDVTHSLGAYHDFAINTGGSERMRIDSSGNVGIGTSSPVTALDVRGEISVDYDATYGLRFYNEDRNNWSSIGNTISTGNSTANLVFKTSVGEVMHMDTIGRVGIGSSNPLYRLAVEDGSGATRVNIRNTANAGPGSGIFFEVLNGGSTVGNGTIATQSNGDMAFFTGTSSGTERWRINTAGHMVPANINNGIILGSTASVASNLLNDYEEGTWTPTYRAGTSGTPTTTSSSGHYRKVGSIVTVSLIISGAPNGASGVLYISGLPFPSIVSGGYGTGHAAIYGQTWSWGSFPASSYVGDNTSNIYLWDVGTANQLVSDMASGGNNLETSFTYITSS